MINISIIYTVANENGATTRTAAAREKGPVYCFPNGAGTGGKSESGRERERVKNDSVRVNYSQLTSRYDFIGS